MNGPLCGAPLKSGKMDSTLRIQAPAKLNLTLEVLGERPDGYHEIRSVLQAVSLYDALYFENGKDFKIECDIPEWSAEKSLVGRAVDLLKGSEGGKRGATIKIEKHIPLVSGLGGDSSDAAAVLRGLNRLWGLDLSKDELIELAAKLGSDVAFFLNGATALAEGRGEKMTPLTAAMELWVVLVVPDVPREENKTAWMYARLRSAHYTDGSTTAQAVDVIHRTGGFSPLLLFNTFENIAFEGTQLRKTHVEHLLKLGAEDVHLAGSGPTLFVMFVDRVRAADFHLRCRDQGMEAYLVKTL
jgi:4-diphosphocytidyl-2-C-methyl-D-erythritol kinase